MSSIAGGPPPQDAPYGALPQDDTLLPPPPGWYPDGSGGLRWWEGRAWSAATAPAAAPSDERVWAVLAHLSLLVMPLVPVLVIRLTVGRRDAFVRHHATEALNAQIFFGIAWNAIGFLLMGVMFSTMDADPSAPPPWPFFVCFAAMGLAFLTIVLGAVVGAVKAHAGVWWRYPVNLRLVRGAVRHAPAGQLPR